jgi:ABC-2 type transport system ATP-binding protein
MIEVQSLSRFYGTHQAVKDVSFSIAANEVVGFLGLNGAGKSTTLKVIAGLIPPSAGTVVIDNLDVTTAPVSFRSRIGYLPEEPPLYMEMTVNEFLSFLGRLRGMTRGTLSKRLPQVIKTCQLSGMENRVIGELSHGYKKRVGIAQAIIHGPSLVILDEPISGLDPVQIVEMRAVIRSLKDEATVLVSSHILSEIEQTCDRILVLRDGELVVDETHQTLAARLNTGNRVKLIVTGPASDAVAVLQAVDGVESVTVNSERDGQVCLEVTMAEDHREALVVALVQAGIGLRQLEDALDELEELFIEMNRNISAGQEAT